MPSLDVFRTYEGIIVALTYNTSINLVAFLFITKTLSLKRLSDLSTNTRRNPFT
jgi:hypothetical protein